MLQFVTLIATIGNVLKIKPILRRNKDGYIVTYKNVRGSKAALNTLINLVCDNIIKPEEQIIDIAHADAYEDSLYIMDKIREKINIRDFINTSYDFCTGSHVVVADFAWHSDPSRFAGTDFLPAEAGRKERHVFLHI